uniref:Small glutamine rich tetratricopeptide repeat co-chaperone beta n=1 Tax=Seriola dumerili TaxID=41447 RepID=A0A3B4U669_SERDU
MAVEKRLAFSIQESLEVAIQCLETTFKISSSDCHLAVPQPLTEIFLNSLLKNDNITIPETSPSPEDIERAEQLKNEGKMCAVECYTKITEQPLTLGRAAAHSKLGNYTEATGDCERAIGIDPTYILLCLSKIIPVPLSVAPEALVLDPENDTYKSNLKIAEQSRKKQPIAAELGFDMASLINNPAFISMAASVMQNQQVQQLMSGMMSNAVGGPAAEWGTVRHSSLIEA